MNKMGAFCLLVVSTAFGGFEPVAAATETPEQLVARAQTLVDDLEYEAAIPVAQAVLDRPDASVETRLDAYVVLGSSLAILGRPAEAEKVFRLLLRGRPDFDMSGADVAPKIMRVFRNVKVEEDRIRRETHALQRKRLIESLELRGQPLSEAEGGEAITFTYRLRDPRSAVNAVRVQYRRRGAGDFSALALTLDATGAWSGSIPGVWTENEDGFILEYFVSTLDKNGEPLLELGSPAVSQPLRVAVAPGSVRSPFYLSFWFWGIAVAVVASSAVAAYLILDSQTRLPDSDLGPHPIP